ncbi:MAG: MTH865 family protein [Methanohalobium sp.]|uniref:MTH865 family protein n=1 Tax=Methanohalobium sp. TaxID=2837493 RepID=UPI0039790DE1
MSVKDDIHTQITGALKGADFPINTPEKLLNAFPEGAKTTCRSGDVEVTAGEAGKLLKPDDFPFNSAKEVADTIVNRANF